MAALAFWGWRNSQPVDDWIEEKSSEALKQAVPATTDEMELVADEGIERPIQNKDLRAPIARRAQANLVEIFSTNDYPAEAIRKEEQGIVGYELSINRLGWVSGCRIVQSSGSRALDKATCDILRSRARFEPARDATGKRITDEYSGRIRWELPEV